VADIHFSHVLALRVLEGGADKLRINPGNIGSRARVEEVVRAAKERRVPIRIGVNAGSLEKDLLEPDGTATPRAMVESALRHIRILEDLDYPDIIVSLKASDVERTVEAYRLLADKVSYPFHLGITEAGSAFTGTIKSAIGVGILLSEGIGDTIRISLTADSVEEVRVGKEILRTFGLRNDGPVVIACPTCGRSEIDMMTITNGIEKGVASIRAAW
jgi:(E)-4-hydroxy-3-methylbut-2-enyl-diphosphate synthase